MIKWLATKRNAKICEIIDLLGTIALMFRTKEQGKYSYYNGLFSCSNFVSFHFDFILLLFVFNALFLVLLCLLHVAKLKLRRILLFSSLFCWCIVLIIASFNLVVKLVSRVSLISSLVL
jgi:hypothetical protein